MQLSLPLPSFSLGPMMNNWSMGAEKSALEKQKEAEKKLRNKALRLLTTREHSRQELLRKLEQSRVRAARAPFRACVPPTPWPACHEPAPNVSRRRQIQGNRTLLHNSRLEHVPRARYLTA